MLDLIEDDSQDYVHIAADSTKLAIGADKDGQISISGDNLIINNVTQDGKIHFGAMPGGGSLETYFTINGEEERLEMQKHLIITNPMGRENAAITLDQNDVDEPFIRFEGSEQTDGSGNINTANSGSYNLGSSGRYIRAQIGSQDYLIPLYIRT